MKFINDLITLQKTEKLSDEKFARKFGIHRQTWIRIRTRKTALTIEFLRKVIDVYPGLRKEAEKFLSGNVTGSN
jgi:transcriptional regulator with XRE-family HTH domain